MEPKELRQKSVPEIQRLLAAWRESLRDKRFRVAQGQHKDVREIREIKRDIARALTHLRQVTKNA